MFYLVILRKKHTRKCHNCGKEFSTYNVEQFLCSNCYLKGHTFKPKRKPISWKPRNKNIIRKPVVEK